MKMMGMPKPTNRVHTLDIGIEIDTDVFSWSNSVLQTALDDNSVIQHRYWLNIGGNSFSG